MDESLVLINSFLKFSNFRGVVLNSAEVVSINLLKFGLCLVNSFDEAHSGFHEILLLLEVVFNRSLDHSFSHICGSLDVFHLLLK
mgnify:CR=1 FL=1